MKNNSGKRILAQKSSSKPKSCSAPAKEGRKQLARPYRPVKPPQKTTKK